MSEKKRDSNIELLRIITIIMIVVLHMDVFILDDPLFYKDSDALRYLTLFIKSLSNIGVNVFVIISGWYGIRINWTRFGGLWFQVFFFSLIGYLYYVFAQNNVTCKDSVKYFFLMTGTEYGFFQSYILLYLLSPMLNSFIKYNNKKDIITLLLFFYLIQTFWGCLSWGYVYYGNGYSVVSYIGLYLIARFAKEYNIGFKRNRNFWFFFYLGLSIGGSAMAFLGKDLEIPNRIAFSYASPLVIISSFAFFSFFNQLDIDSTIINKIAKHCFAVYLFHVNSFIMPIIIIICKSYISAHNTLLSYFLVVVFSCILLFVTSLLLDIVRLTLWNYIVKSRTKIIIR